jgi:hypothetical protein
MRNYRVIFFVFIIACKGSSITTSSEEYSEDLSYLREEIRFNIEEPDVVYVDSIAKNDFAFTKDITQEIDSINNLIILENIKKKYWDGYTIQIYRGNSRKSADEAIQQAKDLFPDSNPTLSYYQPTFRVKMGAYFDRIKANKAYYEVKEFFPNALLLPEKLEILKESKFD